MPTESDPLHTRTNRSNSRACTMTTAYGGADHSNADDSAPMDDSTEGLASPGAAGVVPPSGYQSYQDGASPPSCSAAVEKSVSGPVGASPGNNGDDDDNDDGASVYRPGRPYKGFSTSISSSFVSPSTVRTDCCSMACFGVLQADRTRYLLTGTSPPSPLRRVLIHIIVPGVLFITAGWCAVHIRDASLNQFFSTLLVISMLVYLMSGCMRGTVKRVQVREEMLWRMREVDAIRDQSGYTDEEAREAIEAMGGVRSLGGVPKSHLAGDGEFHHGLELGQSRAEMGCAHRMCGCYASDLATRSIDPEPRPRDLCGCIWRAFVELCCHRMCNCFLQFCGCCALAQEAREIERLVPVGKRRLDYLTFEPYVEYFGPIVNLRLERNSSLWDHYGALSHLSVMVVKSLAIVLVSLFILSLIGSNPNFRLENMAVLLATLAQAFFILYFVHWKWNRFDISLDAVVKYFACGFVLTTGLAVFFEMVETVLLQLMLCFIVLFSNLGVQRANAFEMGGDDEDDAAVPRVGGFTSPLPAFTPVGGHGRYLGVDDPYAAASGDDYMRKFAHSNPVLVVIYLFLNAFAMAALVEELCKYFGYMMVEHPDFLSEDDLSEAAAALIAMDESRDESDADESSDAQAGGSNAGKGGGGDSYAPPTVVVAGKEVGANTVPIDASSVVAKEVNGSTGADVASGISDISTSVFGANLPSVNGPGADKHQAKAGGGGFNGFVSTKRSLNSVGAGITVAMVSVALGFACCENLIYIFVYNGSSIGMEISVLVARSLFPVHPIAAAIQSIGVCRRDLERQRSCQLGRIITPAVLMHGSFDFLLMLISLLVSLRSGNGEDDDDFAAKAEIVSFVLSLAIVLSGIRYYVVQSRAQKKRLDDIDAREGVLGGSRVV